MNTDQQLDLDLLRYRGVSEIKTIYVSKGIKTDAMPKIASSRDVYAIAKALYVDGMIEYREQMYCLFVTRAGRVKGWKHIGDGTLTGCMCDPKHIIKTALDLNAAGIVMIHNHPSGNLTASPSDIALTKRVREAAKLFDIELLEHMIVTAEGYTSLADEGLM